MKRRSAPKPPLRIAATCPRICQAQIGGVGGDGYNGWRPLGSSRLRAFLVMAADALARVRASGAHRATAIAFEFLVRTAGRSDQVRAARWDEVDETAATWTVPPARMKSKREHRVPLSRRAGGRPRRSAGAFRPQRFRVPFADRPTARSATARSPAAARTRYRRCAPRFPVQLPGLGRRKDRRAARGLRARPRHVNSDRVEAAYRRNDLFEKRRSSWPLGSLRHRNRNLDRNQLRSLIPSRSAIRHWASFRPPLAIRHSKWH